MPPRVLLLGGLLMDRFFLTDTYPQRGQDTLVTRHFQQPGGCPYNVAQTLRSLGVTPLIWSALSDDEIGTALSHTLTDQNLPRDAVYPAPGLPTGFCMIVVDREGERTFLTYRGCEGSFDPRRITPALRSVDLLYVTGIYLLYPQWSPAAVDFIEETAAAGTPVLFDPGPLAAEMDPDLLRRTLAASTYLTPSADEAAAVSSLLGIDDLPAWAFARRAACVLETRGSRGALLHTPADTTPVPPFPARVVDTTGTGDSFAAGFIAALLAGRSLPDAARAASACGSLAAEVTGPCRPSWQQVEARMRIPPPRF